MQFHHAHAFRAQVAAALQAEVPDAYERWLAAGAEPISMPLPGGIEIAIGTRSRRQTFERALRDAALAQEGLTLRQGHVDAVTSDHGRATGLSVLA